jgi:hypothetical protein
MRAMRCIATEQVIALVLELVCFATELIAAYALLMGARAIFCIQV